jgi:hypothetical protein
LPFMAAAGPAVRHRIGGQAEPFGGFVEDRIGLGKEVLKAEEGRFRRRVPRRSPGGPIGLNPESGAKPFRKIRCHDSP